MCAIASMQAFCSMCFSPSLGTITRIVRIAMVFPRGIVSGKPKEVAMKRFAGVAAALILMVACCFSLAGCKGSGTEDSQEFIGVWALESVSAESKDMKVSASDVALMQSFGYTATLTLREDGTASFDMFGEVTDCEWSGQDSANAQLIVGEEKVDLTIGEDGVLTMSQGGRESIRFVRAESVSESQSDASSSEDAAVESPSEGDGSYQEQPSGSSESSSTTESASDNTPASDSSADEREGSETTSASGESDNSGSSTEGGQVSPSGTSQDDSSSSQGE